MLTVLGSLRQNEEVIELTEPQVWTLIGVFAASTFAAMGLITSMFTRVLRAEIGGVRAEISGLRGEMNARFEVVGVRFESLDRHLDGLDRDVQALTKRIFDRPD